MDALYAHQLNFNLKTQELTDVYFETSKQHKSATNARILWDK